MSDIEDLLNSAKKNLSSGFTEPEQSLEQEVFSIPKLQAKINAPRVVKTQAPSLKQVKRQKPVKVENAGKEWFGLGKTEMTPEAKRDLQLLKMRHVLDPKRFYKTADDQSKFFAIGTLQEDKSEFYSARTNRKDRRQTLAQEILHQRPDYFRSRYEKIQAKKKSGGKSHYKKVKSMRA